MNARTSYQSPGSSRHSDARREAAANVPWQIHHSGKDTMACQVADWLSSRLAQTVEQKGQALLCVSGGTSPIPMFQQLAKSALPWSRITVTLVDERLVPEHHPASNAKLVQEHLLQGPAKAAQWQPWVFGGQMSGDVHLDLVAQSERVERLLDRLGPADLMVLGMGEDGHIASLFPQASNLQAALALDQTHPCLPVFLNPPPPNAPFHRISVTLAYILKSAALVLPASGASKQAVLQSAMVSEQSPLPVARVLHQTTAPLHIWMSS